MPATFTHPFLLLFLFSTVLAAPVARASISSVYRLGSRTLASSTLITSNPRRSAT
ncbi:hypothetical protein FRB94_013413 [Tulasnella sp. JGI-2019a]|nr:hypothetical protein FRB94_013413 [Tulasnella sp. JGI-2019a]